MRSCLTGAALVLPQLLYSCKNLFVHNGRLGIGKNPPVLWGIIQPLFQLVGFGIDIEVHCAAGVFWTLQYSRDRLRTPLVRLLRQRLSVLLGVEVVEQIAERGEIIVPFVTVRAVIDGDILNIALGKEALGLVAHFQIVPPHAGHVLDNDGFDLSCLGQPDHFIPAWTVKRHPGNAVVDENRGIGETAVSCVFQKGFSFDWLCCCCRRPARPLTTLKIGKGKQVETTGIR